MVLVVRIRLFLISILVELKSPHNASTTSCVATVRPSPDFLLLTKASNKASMEARVNAPESPPD